MKRSILFALGASLVGCVDDPSKIDEPVPSDELEPQRNEEGADPRVAYSFTASNMAYDYFGYAVATADFNGDSLLDLAVGAPGESDEFGGHDYGAVYTYYGTSSGGLTRGTKLVGMSFGGFDKQSVGSFGFALAVGDFNGDNRNDLAVGAPTSDIDGFDAGAVFLYVGTSTGLSPNRVITACSESLASCNGGDLFGVAVAAGAIADSNHDSLVIGASGKQVQTYSPFTGYEYRHAGAVFIVHRSGEGFKGTFLKGTFEREQFGAKLAVGDLNSDGRADVAIGAPAFDDDAGRVVLYAGRRPPETQPSLWSAMATYKGSLEHTTRNDGDRFGAALVIAELDAGNANNELAVGIPGVGFEAGVVSVFENVETSTGAWDQAIDWNLYGTNGSAFGWALAAGHLTSNTFDQDLVVGAPGYADGGRVAVYNHTTLITARTQTQLHSAFPTEQGDMFASALAVRNNKLVIGVHGEAPELVTPFGIVEDPNAGAIEWLSGSNGALGTAMFIHQESAPY